MGENNYSVHLELLKKDEESLLNFLKAKFPMFHNSNFFYRDLQYGIRSFLEKKDIIINYNDADELAHSISKYFEDKGIFIKVNDLTWRVDYPKFITTEPGDPF
jgi:hypothetical protein